MQHSTKPPAYFNEKKTESASRRSSATSSTISSVSSRISDVSGPASRASSISTNGSFISRYSVPQVLEPKPAASFEKPAQTSKQQSVAEFSVYSRRPGYQPITISNSKRFANLSLRFISAAEEADFQSCVVKKQQTHYIDGGLANQPSLYKPAIGYMLDFDIVRKKGVIPCTVRLSCCNVWYDRLVSILGQAQKELEMGMCTRAALPAGMQLVSAGFAYGLAGFKASSAQLSISDTIPEPSLSCHSATITKFGAVFYAYPSEAEKESLPSRKSQNCDWSATVRVPSLSVQDSRPVYQKVEWSRLLGLETAFPDWLYLRDNKTIQAWLGPFEEMEKSGKPYRRSLHFEVRDVQRNLKGDIISARLVKIAGPKFIKAPVKTAGPKFIEASHPERPTPPGRMRTQSSTRVSPELIEETVKAAERDARRQRGGGLLSKFRPSGRD